MPYPNYTDRELKAAAINWDKRHPFPHHRTATSWFKQIKPQVVEAFNLPPGSVANSDGAVGRLFLPFLRDLFAQLDQHIDLYGWSPAAVTHSITEVNYAWQVFQRLMNGVLKHHTDDLLRPSGFMDVLFSENAELWDLYQPDA